MYFTGFADEAAQDIEGQIRATTLLGWKHIEARGINGKNLGTLSDTEFDAVYGALQNAGVTINCYGSTIANWGKRIDAPFDDSVADARVAIPRMQKLGAGLVRIMSFAVLRDRGPEDQMEDERFRRLRILCKMFADAGIQPVHENCMNYGGMGWTYTLRLIENVPGLKLVFDTGNPVMTDDRTKTPPYPKQSSWEFYTHVKPHVAYVHVKDCQFINENPDSVFPAARHVFPGEGDGDVVRTVRDLIAGGYDGGFSIEPHMEVVFHDQSVEARADARIANYVEYGRRLERIVAECRAAGS
jgi:sugar phosphate isomerase/epimerase